MNLLKSLAAVSSMTMFSRVLGFIRDAIIARIFGAGMATDAFFVAFKLPNLLRRIFAEGSEAAIEDQTLVLLYRDKESVLQIDQNRLVKRPGYEIFSSNLQSAQFYKEDTCIYLRWKHTHEKTTKQALLGC